MKQYKLLILLFVLILFGCSTFIKNDKTVEKQNDTIVFNDFLLKINKFENKIKEYSYDDVVANSAISEDVKISWKITSTNKKFYYIINETYFDIDSLFLIKSPDYHLAPNLSYYFLLETETYKYCMISFLDGESCGIDVTNFFLLFQIDKNGTVKALYAGENAIWANEAFGDFNNDGKLELITLEKYYDFCTHYYIVEDKLVYNKKFPVYFYPTVQPTASIIVPKYWNFGKYFQTIDYTCNIWN